MLLIVYYQPRIVIMWTCLQDVNIAGQIRFVLCLFLAVDFVGMERVKRKDIWLR